MRRTITRASTTAATLAVAALALTACAGGTAPEEEPAAKVASQTKAEACDTLNTSFEDVFTPMLETQIGSLADPEAALQLLKDSREEIEGMANTIGNAEVKEVFDPLATAFVEYIDLNLSIAEDPEAMTDSAALEDAFAQIMAQSSSLGELSTEFAEFCGS